MKSEEMPLLPSALSPSSSESSDSLLHSQNMKRHHQYLQRKYIACSVLRWLVVCFAVVLVLNRHALTEKTKEGFESPEATKYVKQMIEQGLEYETEEMYVGSTKYHLNGIDDDYDDDNDCVNVFSGDGNTRWHPQRKPLLPFLVSLYRSRNTADHISCDPKHIHIAQRTNVNVGGLVSMTVSLTLDYKHCSMARPFVVYQNMDTDDDIHFALGSDPLQFNYTSEETDGDTYQSDWIYHIELPNLQAGLQLYFYSIVVFQYNYMTQEQLRHLNVEDLLQPRGIFNVDNKNTVDNDDANDSVDNKEHHRINEHIDQKFGISQQRYLSTRKSFRKQAKQKQKDKNRQSPNENTGTSTSSSSTTSTAKSPITVLSETTQKLDFRTPPFPGQPTSIALVGDLGQTCNSQKTVANILQYISEKKNKDKSDDEDGDGSVQRQQQEMQPPDVVISNLLIAGDLSYADSDPYRWESFLEIMEPLFSHLPLSVVVGNHEIECDTDTNAVFVPYENYFHNPNRIRKPYMEPISNAYLRSLPYHSCISPSEFQSTYYFGNSFYSYTHGAAHIIVLNSYTFANETSIQYRWLVHELQNNFNRALTPWLIVSFHAPLYTSFIGHFNERTARSMQKAMEPIFEQFGVNLVISGHDHAYMRTYPISYNPDNPFKPRIDPTGLAPISLTLGAGGNREGHNPGYLHPFHQESWVAKRTLQDYGYGLLQIHNSTHAYFEWIKDFNVDKRFHDHLWILNGHAS